VSELTAMLRDQHHIAHATLQLECADCGPAQNSWRCSMSTDDGRGGRDRDALGHIHGHDGHDHSKVVRG